MENVVLSRRNPTSKKGDKENIEPAHGGKSFIKREKTSSAPLKPKGNKKEEIMAKDDALKAKVKQADLRSVSAAAQRNVKTAQRVGKLAPSADVQRQTHSQALRTEQAAKHKKVSAEAPKPPAAVPPVKSAPGMYKGKIVQSKIGSIWKSSSTQSVPDLKPSAAVAESRRAGLMKTRSKSVSEVSERGARKPGQMGNAQVTKAFTSSRPAAGLYSARLPSRTIPTTQFAASSRKATVIPSKAGGSQSLKPKVPVIDKKVNKAPVSSTLSQYRLTTETVEERRAKLSEWLASKGKTLKRPAMTTSAAAPPNTKTNAKHEANVKPTSRSEVHQPAAQKEPAHKPNRAAQCADVRVAEPAVATKSPLVMNTSLELLENSDADSSIIPQGEIDDIVVNLCYALEAMATPSGCNNENPEETDECSDAVIECSKAESDCKEEGTSEDVEEMLNKEEERNVQVVEGEDEEVEYQDEDEMERGDDASVIKYSVKTTPYLQSVKKTLEGEASASSSKRKSNIKDLKFLTPVRRSCRIQRKSSRLPTMLVDHDPCVSSLAELVNLDDDANAYIYRKNTALLDDLPDKPKL